MIKTNTWLKNAPKVAPKKTKKYIKKVSNCRERHKTTATFGGNSKKK